MDQILSSSQRLLRWAQFDEHFFSGVGFASWIYLLLSPMAVNAFFYLTSRSCTGSNSSASGSPADPSCAPLAGALVDPTWRRRVQGSQLACVPVLSLCQALIPGLSWHGISNECPGRVWAANFL